MPFKREKIDTGGKPAEKWFAVNCACAKSALSAFTQPDETVSAQNALNAHAHSENNDPEPDWDTSDSSGELPRKKDAEDDAEEV